MENSGVAAPAYPLVSTESIVTFMLIWIFFILIIIWTIIWKSIALWKAARSGQKVWFIVLMLVNTFGILEIVYILWLTAHQKHTQNILPQEPNKT